MFSSIMMLVLFLLFTSLVIFSKAFVPTYRPTSFRTGSSSLDGLKVTLEKPLGLILEETDNGKGVYVKDFAESGSALEYSDKVAGSVVKTVMGEDVTELDFDSVMEKIVSAPETVDLEFAGDDAVKEISDYAIGSPVTITYQQPGGDSIAIEARVGDNLRQTLLDAGIEVYEGMRQKLGNCGGAGQCTFCAMDFLESDGWVERSDYENDKLKKFPSSRLACLNNIQGPATVQKTKR